MEKTDGFIGSCSTNLEESCDLRSGAVNGLTVSGFVANMNRLIVIGCLFGTVHTEYHENRAQVLEQGKC